MRIAIVYDAVYPYCKGGAERRYHELALRLARLGHEVHWYGMHWWDGPRTMRSEGITYHGVCRRRPLYTSGGRRSILQALVFGVSSIRLAGQRFDVVDCCGFPYFSLFTARSAVRLRGGRLVSTWHEVWGREYWAQYLGRWGVLGALVERAAAKTPCHVVAVSAATARELKGLLRRHVKVTVLPNGVDCDTIAAHASQGRRCDVMYAGRLCDFKDVELLLEAVALLVHTRPQITCRIVGGGPHLVRLTTFVEDLGLTDRVEFTGELPEAGDVYAALSQTRVLVSPSQREGFGIVVVEANAAGVPVVVAAHPHNSAVELVDGANGLVVAPVPGAVASAVDKLLAEPRGVRAVGCRRAARAYDWDSIAAEYEDLLNRVSA